MKLARASRGLNRLVAINKDGYTIMALAYGPGSEVWQQQGFPLGGLYNMTAPGRNLIGKILNERSETAARFADIQLPHLLHNDLRAAEHLCDGDRMAMYGAADGASSRLLGEVSSVWVDLHRPS